MGCSIEGCLREPRSSRAPLCELHRTRLLQRGTTDDPPIIVSLRIQEKAIGRCYLPEAVEPGECWEWPGPLSPTGYGLAAPRFKVGSSRLAHRTAFTIAFGREAENLVCHHCDNPRCYRASHLFDGTHADNTADMIAKGRAHQGPTWQTFTDEQVSSLRADVTNGMTIKDAAEKAGISHSYASRLVNNRRRTPTEA